MTSVSDEAEAFLSALAPDGELTFQTFDDAKRRRKELSRILHGAYRTKAQALADLNQRGAGCFVMVNRGDSKGRRIENVKSVRALFLDLDGAPLGPVLKAPIPPPIVCESSPGKFHAYWPITGIPLADFGRAQKAIAANYGGDAKVCDLPRVMRLPGFLHLKAEPVRSRLIQCDPVKPWEWRNFADAMGLPFQLGGIDAGRFVEGKRNDGLYLFAYGLKRQGVAADEGLRRVMAANDSRCDPPLSPGEVAGIVESAWKTPAIGFVKLDWALIDRPEYLSLSADAKQTLTALIRAYNGSNNGRIVFTCETALSWGMSRRRRRNALQELDAAGFIEYTRHGMPGGDGHRATPDFFRLTFLAE